MTTATETSRSDPLLDPAFMARLDQLDVVSRKVLAGKMKGERRSKRRGQSVEFADFRNYVVGDDLRFIDWNIYARLDKLFLKLFLEEEDLALYVLIDTSMSMDFGDPNKARPLYEAAKNSSHHHSPDHQYYAQVKERHDAKIAAISVARQLARRCYHVLCNLDPDIVYTMPN